MKRKDRSTGVSAHPLDARSMLEAHAAASTPQREIPSEQLEQMKWHGIFYRRNDAPGLFMMRVRVPAGELTADQARAVAFVALEFGHGIVDLTNRQNLQVQGLALCNVPRALERLEAVGLSCKQTGQANVRNVYGHPFSGFDPHELMDVRPLCHALTQLVLDDYSFSDLPHKFNVALHGREQHSAHFWTQDVSFLAARAGDHGIGFQVLVGGKQGQTPVLGRHLPILVSPEQVVAVTRSLLELYREQGVRQRGERARFAFLVDRLGIGGVLRFLENTLPFPLMPAVAPPPPAVAYDDLVGFFPQKQPNQWVLGVAVPLGRLTWQQFEGVAIAAKRWGNATLRVTHDQSIAIPFVNATFKDALAIDLGRYGLSPYADSVTRGIFACTGKQFCNLAVTETKSHALRLAEKLRQRTLTLHGIRIHMSGCASSCIQHHTADIGLKGVRVRRLFSTREGFDVYLGGGISGQVHLGIPYKLAVDVEQLPSLIDEVVREYYLQHRAGQTFSAYWREKLHQRDAVLAGDADYRVPIWLCESCQYRHEGEDPPVFCPRCAALRRHFARLDETDSDEATPVGTDSSQATPSTRAMDASRARTSAAVDEELFEAEYDSVPDAEPPIPFVPLTIPGHWPQHHASARAADLPAHRADLPAHRADLPAHRADGENPTPMPLDPIRRATASLVEWLQKVGQKETEEPAPKRGRPRDPKVAERDSLIRRLFRERPTLSHAEIAQLVEQRMGEEVTTHMVHNALKKRSRGQK